MNLKIIAPLPNINKRTRLTKITECAPSSTSVYFYGWQRQHDEIISDNSHMLLKGGGYSSKKARLMYFLWMVKVFFLSLQFQKTDTVWALGFESAFPAIIASKLKGFKVIYDDADRFSSLFHFPSFIKKLLIKLEVYSSHHCFKHIIPGKERYEFESPNFFILKNTPTQSDLDKAKQHPLNESIKQKTASYPLIVYVNGWLGEGRGLRIIHDVAQKLPQIGFLLAGRIDSQFAEKMLDFHNVHYLGELPQYEALSYYEISDFVFTYYDPKIPINRMAEANKWGDALQFSTPVLVNSEVMTAQYLRDADACISVDYENIDALVMALQLQLSNPQRHQGLVQAIKALQKKFPTFDIQLQTLFKLLE